MHEVVSGDGGRDGDEAEDGFVVETGHGDGAFAFGGNALVEVKLQLVEFIGRETFGDEAEAEQAGVGGVA